LDVLIPTLPLDNIDNLGVHVVLVGVGADAILNVPYVVAILPAIHLLELPSPAVSVKVIAGAVE
jgi:hypothetical protein